MASHFDLISRTGFDFVCSLSFMLCLSVLLRPFYSSPCIIVFIVCRRRCYTVATFLVLAVTIVEAEY